MRSISTRRGSALLVVLGMLAFMVISAVAFSAWMRYSRLPSSFLRRSSASRLLAKAALAEAIDEIDAAIGNNPHPGVGTQSPRLGAGSLAADLNGLQNESSQTRNHWQHRVYIGTNRLHSADDTVSTLTLEGLAYIPPALVNEVRYYSRRSQAGVWKNLGFDAGRYAFCAIDVSDHFDVNALSAGLARDASAAGRISLAYLFENDGHTGYATDPKAWDQFLVAAGTDRVPVVSVADLNLMLNDRKPAGWESPFCRYVDSGGSDFYSAVGITDPTGAAADKIKRMSFVADGWFPPTAAANEDDADYDLSDPEYQPFEKADLEADTPSLARFINAQSMPTASLLFERLSALGLATLYDYLDDDNVPVSLAFPSVERIPMICGIGSTGLDAASIKFQSNYASGQDDTQSDNYPNVIGGGSGPDSLQRKIERTTYYKLSGTEFVKFLQGTVKAVVAYPFRRGCDVLDAGACSKFTLEGTLSVFFSTGAFDSRSGGTLLRVENDAAFTAKTLPTVGSYSAFHIPLKFSTFSNYSFDGVDSAENAVIEADSSPLTANVPASDIGTFLEKDENAILTVVEQWDQTRQKDPMTGKLSPWEPAQPPKGSVVSATSAINPIASGGESKNLGNLGENGSAKVAMRSALWLRLKNGNGKTVDLVPACLEDDTAFLGSNVGGVKPLLKDIVGKSFPLMAAGGTEFDIGKEALSSATATPLQLALGLNVMCIDPRWNWAPEHWYAPPSANVTKDAWLTAVGGEDKPGFIAKDGRECDIFLATSDAGYMQSVYELAFLPRWTDLKGSGNNQICGNMEKISEGKTEWATDPEQTVNARMMWRSYHPFATDTGAARDDAFEELGIVNAGGGFKVNPYSDSTNVVMAAFANTPFDWWAACTNTVSRGGKIPHISQSERQDVQNFNKNYAFNEMNGEAKFKWKDLQAVAQRFIDRMHQSGNANRSWTDVFDELGWDEENFCGVNLSGDELYDVDRKFLYGYWRECFAAKQQLFLVFVRAEPMMMGGGSIGQTPPQLGSRAVALVWRDPTASPDNNTPHKTRVLFYRQFD